MRAKKNMKIFLCFLFFSYMAYAENDKILYQVAPLSALVYGVYDGSYSYAKLKQHGDFGLGTFNYLDGEMVALNGKFYQMRADGTIRLAHNNDLTPFAEVCYFNPILKDLKLKHIESFSALVSNLKQHLSSKNTPYAIKISGNFPYLKLRAVLKQNTLGVPLVEAARQEKIFEFHNVKGYLVGYWFPQYLSGIAVAGLHLHFISSDYKHGGHVLDLQLNNATMDIMPIDSMQMYFPHTADFNNANLDNKDITKKINQAEAQH